MPTEYSVVIADFLDEATIEAPILGDIARITLAAAHDESELAGYLDGADALILFHDIALVGEATFSRSTRCKCIVRAGVGYNNVDRDAAAKHGVIVCHVPAAHPPRRPWPVGGRGAGGGAGHQRTRRGATWGHGDDSPRARRRHLPGPGVSPAWSSPRQTQPASATTPG